MSFKYAKSIKNLKSCVVYSKYLIVSCGGKYNILFAQIILQVFELY